MEDNLRSPPQRRRPPPQCLGEPTDLAEVECVVANLIYRGYVKGYISHQKAVLVVSKKDPFPTAAVMKR